MNSDSFTERKFHLKTLWPLFFFVGCIWAISTNCAAQTGLGLITRSNWFGDPYLVTNPPGNALSPFRVCLVVNPSLVTNQDYQAKVNALAATEVPDQSVSLVEKILRSARLAWFHPGKSEMSVPSVSTFVHQWPPLIQALTGGGILWPPLFQRWALFVLVTAFLARRGWRYFREVEDDDDFADHLATLAAAHRWVFPVYMALLTAVAAAEFLQFGNSLFSLSVLLVASSLRKYYCEGDFADYPLARKIHFAACLALAWLGWTLGTGGWGIWLLLAAAILGFRALINSPDLAEQRRQLPLLLFSFLGIWMGGGIVGSVVLHVLGMSGSAGHGFFVGGLFGCSLLATMLFVTRNPVFMQMTGGVLVDMFLPRFFGQKARRKRHLPELLLLRHWRDHGDVAKAWQAARSHLFAEARALPVWLFAMETAVLHRRKPGEALEILSRLCATEAFHYDQRSVAVAQMQGWMAAAGFKFDSARFKLERPPLPPTALTNQIEQKCREGRSGEAATLLRAILEKDSLNEEAFVQLARLYCQDLKNRPAAEKLIAAAAETFSPNLLEFLNRSLDEWIRLPARCQLKRKKFPGWLRRAEPAEPGARKLSLIAPPIAQPPAPPDAADPLQRYLDRVKQARGKSPAPAPARDQVEQLLLERRLGTAVELLKQQAEARPENFDLWLRYAEAQGDHCGNLHAAEKIIERMEHSGHFKKAELKKAHTRLKKWRNKHAGIHNW